jgi:dTDP-3,4-didehydro-2,6-dideoxy-alpha-D-glucose 3-reductase
VTPVRFGVMGGAEIATRRMLPAMMSLPAIEVIAVASRDEARASAIAARFRCDPEVGYAALLRRDDVEAVYIPLPPALHATWVRAALLAGKSVLAEKPLAIDGAQAAALLELADVSGLVLMENVMFVHHHQHAVVREMLCSGAIGELRAFHAWFTIPRRPDHDIRYQPQLGGGALWDVGVYPVRAALHFLGRELAVAGAVLTRGAGRQVHTSGSVLLRAPDDCLAHLTFGLEHSYRSACEFLGSDGRMIVDRAFTPPADYRPVIRIDRQSGSEDVVLDPDDQVANTLLAFTRAVRGGPAPDTEDCLRQIELLDQVRVQAARFDGDDC